MRWLVAQLLVLTGCSAAAPQPASNPRKCTSTRNGIATTVVIAGLVGLTLQGCSGGDNESDSQGTRQPGLVLLITKAEGQNDSTWQEREVRIRISEGCILLNGQLAVFPYGTRLMDDSSAVQLDGDSDPILLAGEAIVQVIGSHVPLGEEGDWDHAMDAENLARWSDCRQRVNVSEYADWWQVSGMRLD